MAFLSRKCAPSVKFVEILNTTKKLQKKKIDFHKTIKISKTKCPKNGKKCKKKCKKSGSQKQNFQMIVIKIALWVGCG